MKTIGLIFIVPAIAALLVAYNTQRVPFGGQWGLNPTREERPQLFANFVSVCIGMIAAGGMLLAIDFLGIFE